MKLLLFDGFSIICRAFYAIPLLTNREGEYTNAVYGFLSIFFRFLDEEKPDYVAVAFDLPKPTFRHSIYGAYKGTRKTLPDELRAQVPILKDLLKKMKISTPETAGYEADDILGTLARIGAEQGMKPVIVSGDRDLLQLATEDVKIRIPKTKSGKTIVEDYNAKDVVEKYGVPPEAYVDVKALMGDASDNIPGVPGIGEVTATKIIASFGSLHNAIDNVSDVKPAKASKNLEEFQEQARLSYKLAKIDTNVPIELNLTPPSKMWNESAYEEVKRLELKTLYKRFEAGQKTLRDETFERSTVIITTAKEAEVFVNNLQNAAITILWSEKSEELTLLDSVDGPIVGVGIAPENSVSGSDLGGAVSQNGHNLIYIHASKELKLLEIIKPWLESDTTKWIFDFKSELKKFEENRIKLGGTIHDVMLASYVFDIMTVTKNISDVAKKHLNMEQPTLEDLLENKGKRSKDRKKASDLPIGTLAEYASVSSSVVLESFKGIEASLSEDQQRLYSDIELPLACLLAKIEKTGIEADKNFLLEFGNVLDRRIQEYENSIYELAEEKFNINSTSQLGSLLFDKLMLKGGKTTTKGFSTAADVLEKLKTKHPIVPLALEYRTHQKLKSTYVDGLLPLICQTTGRIHTTFHQALTATGRLSSSDPNLQNIPIRTALGRELRKAFVSRSGCVFVDADYNQIELRLLAHMSDDPVLIKAYNEDIDIHRLTAAQVHLKNPDEVTDEERSSAKAVNFGIVYGMSAFGLGEDLGISVNKATRYIQGYFEKYSGVKRYQESCVLLAKKNGYVTTMFGRRRRIDELKSKNRNIRGFGERAAMNTPLQGSAADIMKIAMLNVDKRLRKENLKAQIVLQVHDELLVETPTHEIEQVKAAVKEEMEGAAKLKVPLVVNVNVGTSWYDAK